MIRLALLPFVLATGLAATPPADTRIKIDTVPAEYRPTAGTERSAPLSMEDFYFEVNKETGRARIVVEYTYPDAIGDQADGDSGPQPTLAQLPGLNYDPSARAVVYEAGGKRTVCAVVREKKGLRGAHLSTTKTGSCVVTATVDNHVQDDGWALHRFRALDTYFEVR